MNMHQPHPPQRPEAGQGEADYARFDIETPFDAAWLRAYFADPERLLRLNPFYTIRELQRPSPHELHLRLRNEALDRDFDLVARFEDIPDGWRLRWDGWLKGETRWRIEEQPSGYASSGHASSGRARLVLIDDYSARSEAERERRIDEVDTSIAAWAQNIHAWLHMLARFSWLPGFARFMSGPWLRMTPAARRISKWLIAITIAEFALFLMVFTIFRLEHGG